jgi:hypothetical protein
MGVTSCAPGSVGECEGMNLHTSKGAFTLGVEVPMDSQIFRERLQGLNPMDWKVLYIIEKFLEHRCLKWACMTHLDISNTSYGQKKGRESNWQFDFWPLKVENCLNFLMCRWRATYYWKALDKGYNFSLDLISIEGLHEKLWAPKIAGVLVVRILGFPLGNFETKWHLGVGLVARHRIYYKGEGGFSQVRVVVSLVNLCLPMVSPCIKVFQLCTNQLVV